METIGVRELRQHASRYVARASHGETIEITDRGQPVALLTPIGAGGDLLAQLIASGSAHPARGSTAGLAAMVPLSPISPGPSTEEVLDELREDRL
jgi:prevent-host-death family protein